jgi:hypothetical protein
MQRLGLVHTPCVLRGSLRLFEKESRDHLSTVDAAAFGAGSKFAAWALFAYMRTTLLLSAGAGVILISLLLRFLRRTPSHDDAGSVSGQWIAEQSARADDKM